MEGGCTTGVGILQFLQQGGAVFCNRVGKRFNSSGFDSTTGWGGARAPKFKDVQCFNFQTQNLTKLLCNIMISYKN